MGCCNSKPEAIEQEEGYIPQRNNNNQQVPPIVITKAHSITSVDSLPASTSANATTTIQQQKDEHEKPPVIIEEQTQEHQYGEPPAFEKHATSNPKATNKDIKPVVVMTPQSMSDPTLIPASTTTATSEDTYDNTSPSTTQTQPASSLPSTTTTATTTTNTNNNNTTASWPVLVRLSTSSVKDQLIDIPTSAPFMTVYELKKKLTVEPDHQIKLIHLGRILQDNFTLVPSNTTSSIKSDTIKVSKRGVIQAMIYKV